MKISQLLIAMLVLSSIVFQPLKTNAGEPERVALREFIDNYAKQVGKDIVVDPRLKGSVAMSSELTPGRISAEEFYSTLLIHNFGAVESDGTIQIIQASKLKHHKLPFYDGKNRNGLAASQIVSAIIRVDQQRSASDLAPQLRPYVAQWGNVIPDAHSNSLMVVSTVENVERLLNLVRRLDS